jgi:uncharacterized protein YgbK (DUF1537 family)
MKKQLTAVATKKRAYRAAGDILYSASQSSDVFREDQTITEEDRQSLVDALMKIAAELYAKGEK